MLARPGVERGRHVPSPHRMRDMSKEEMQKLAHENGKCMCLVLSTSSPLIFLLFFSFCGYEFQFFWGHEKALMRPRMCLRDGLVRLGE